MSPTQWGWHIINNLESSKSFEQEPVTPETNIQHLQHSQPAQDHLLIWVLTVQVLTENYISASVSFGHTKSPRTLSLHTHKHPLKPAGKPWVLASCEDAPNPIEHPWDMPEQVWSMGDPQDSKDLLPKSRCQTPKDTLSRSCVRVNGVRAFSAAWGGRTQYQAGG